MTNTWVTAGGSTFTFPGNGIDPLGLSVVIPAGGRLVKWVLHGMQACFNQSGSNQTNTGLWRHFCQLHFSAGPYSGRNIFFTERTLKQEYIAFHDSVINSTTYTMFANGCDVELGAEGQTSYGGPGKAAMTLQCQLSLTQGAPAMSAVVNNFAYQATFSALYTH